MNALKYLLVIGCVAIFGCGVADARILRKSEADVTQVRIVTGVHTPDKTSATAWGVESKYIGPGDILKLIRIDIYLDGEQRISSVKVTRLNNVGDRVTLLFADVKELSIQTLKRGAMRQHKKIPIFINSADSLTFP